jgi:hypothetical protein
MERHPEQWADQVQRERFSMVTHAIATICDDTVSTPFSVSPPGGS